MTKINHLDQAKTIFKKGFNCCQAVFTPFALEKGVNEEAVLMLSSGFAAGLCFQGETCGAVIGAQMAIGLNIGYAKPGDQHGRDMVKKSIAEHRKKFVEKYGSTLCKELVGDDPSTEEGLNYLKENGVFKAKCPGFVADSVEILQAVLNKSKGLRNLDDNQYKE